MIDCKPLVKKALVVAGMVLLCGIFVASPFAASHVSAASTPASARYAGGGVRPNSISACEHLSPPPPSWFFPDLTNTANFFAYYGGYSWMPGYTSGWNGVAMALIACYESSYQLGANNNNTYWGMWQMSLGNIQNYLGSNGWSCYMYGCYGFANWAIQDYVALRYVHDRYGSPLTAWNHEVNYGWY